MYKVIKNNIAVWYASVRPQVMEWENIQKTTQQEYNDYLQDIKNKKSTLVSISLPISILSQVQEKLQQIILIFSDIKRNPDDKGNLVLSNININHVSSFLTQEEYDVMVGLGVVFDDKINDLFATE